MNRNLNYRNLEQAELETFTIPKDYHDVADIIEGYKNYENKLFLTNDRALLVITDKKLLITEISVAQKNSIHTTRAMPMSLVQEIFISHKSQADVDAYSDIYINYGETTLTLSFSKLSTAKIVYKHMITCI